MQQPSSSRSTRFPLGIGAPSSRKAAGLPCLGATHRIRQLLVPAQKSSAALLEGPFFNRAMARVDDRSDRRINRAISSVAVMMLAANRIAGKCNGRQTRADIRGSIENTSRRFGRVALLAEAYEAGDTQQMLNCVEQVPRRLATRLANSRETTTHEEQRA